MLPVFLSIFLKLEGYNLLHSSAIVLELKYSSCMFSSNVCHVQVPINEIVPLSESRGVLTQEFHEHQNSRNTFFFKHSNIWPLFPKSVLSQFKLIISQIAIAWLGAIFGYKLGMTQPIWMVDLSNVSGIYIIVQPTVYSIIFRN